MIRLLSLSGSLRADSLNSHALIASARLAPAGVALTHYEQMGVLPHFNPDLEDPLPDVIVSLRALVGQADGLVISCPEYARGIPGSFKNVLDWLVGSVDFPGKPVALFNTSPRASAAQAALRLVLETMSAIIVEDACATIPLLGKKMGAGDIANDPFCASAIRDALDAMVGHIATPSAAVGL